MTERCATCHDGTRATGVGTRHIKASTSCDACHSTTTWQPVTRVDHGNVQGSCSSCHDGVIAKGKHANHIVTRAECDNCHTATAWKPAKFDHSPYVNNCASCHDGTRAKGRDPTHLRTTEVCESCHVITAWKPASTVDHSQVQGSCAACHNGTTATGKTTNHIPTTQGCDSCHSTTTWSTGRFDHTGVTTGCSGCHNGTTAMGRQCDPHREHAGLRSLPCHGCLASGCSRRSRAGAGHLRLLPQRHDRHRAEARGHIPDHCRLQYLPHDHAWKPANFTRYGQVTAGCSSCHNGTNATGKTSSHIPTTAECGSCHATTAWKPATFDHSGITETCANCHDGTRATGKHAAHIPTTDTCGTCHTTTAWKPARFSHDGITATCASCHDGVRQTGRSNTHVQSTDACGACHTTVTWRPVARVDHAQVTGSCYSCHNGTTATGKHRGARPVEQQLRRLPRDAGLEAGDTRGPPRSDRQLLLLPQRDDRHRQAGDSHRERRRLRQLPRTDGLEAREVGPHRHRCELRELPRRCQGHGQGASHLATSDSCESCHAVSGWKPATRVDHGQVSGSSGCHNGTLGAGAGSDQPSRPPAECGSCHALAWKPASAAAPASPPGARPATTE